MLLFPFCRDIIKVIREGNKDFQMSVKQTVFSFEDYVTKLVIPPSMQQLLSGDGQMRAGICR